jgi:hypothetical protein
MASDFTSFVEEVFCEGIGHVDLLGTILPATEIKTEQ